MIDRKRVYSSGSGTSIMAALSTGDPAPQFSLPAIDGSTFNMADTKGKRVILTFFRFSSCPLCNMRIRRIIQRWDEFSEDGHGRSDAKIEMKKHNAEFILNKNHGVKKSFFKFNDRRVTIDTMRIRFHDFLSLIFSLIQRCSTI